jgi:hypothetical protein
MDEYQNMDKPKKSTMPFDEDEFMWAQGAAKIN